LLFFIACEQQHYADPLANIISQSGWHSSQDTPLIKAGDFIAKGVWADPSVLKEEGHYVMYMTSSVKEPFNPPILTFRAISKDGIKWKLDPQKPIIDASNTPFVSVETPNVVKFKGIYHMYYTGIFPSGSRTPMAIGHAVSKDGIHWKKDREPLLISSNNISDWNGYLVAEPGAIVYHNKIYLYFTAIGARKGGNPPQWQTIGLIQSEDGQHFDTPFQLFGQSSLYPASKGFVGYSTPAAYVLDGKVHLVYDVAHYQKNRNPEWQQIAIHHAVSEDGMKNFVQDKQPILTRKDFSWTSGEISGPFVLIDSQQIKLWFAGHVSIPELAPMIQRGWKGNEFGIGLISRPLD
jgi:predicted GH43/DUF377 family glycosyl hydrolase